MIPCQCPYHRFAVDGLSLVSELVQKSKPLILFQIAQLNSFHKVSSLKIGQETHYERVFLVRVDLIDPHQVLNHFVHSW